jgi:hypothetical protein
MPLVDGCRHAVPYTRWTFVLVNFTSDPFQGHEVKWFGWARDLHDIHPWTRTSGSVWPSSTGCLAP